MRKGSLLIVCYQLASQPKKDKLNFSKQIQFQRKTNIGILNIDKNTIQSWLLDTSRSVTKNNSIKQLSYMLERTHISRRP